jgi:hypothetical protein
LHHFCFSSNDQNHCRQSSNRFRTSHRLGKTFGYFGLTFAIFENILASFIGYGIPAATLGGGIAGIWMARTRVFKGTHTRKFITNAVSCLIDVCDSIAMPEVEPRRRWPKRFRVGASSFAFGAILLGGIEIVGGFFGGERGEQKPEAGEAEPLEQIAKEEPKESDSPFMPTVPGFPPVSFVPARAGIYFEGKY